MLFLKRSHRYGFVNSVTKISRYLIQRWKTCLERCSLLITAFIPSWHQRSLSAIFSGPDVIILSCPDVHLICINDLSSLTMFLLNLLICKLTFIDVCTASCNAANAWAYTFVMCKIKSTYFTYLTFLYQLSWYTVESNKIDSNGIDFIFTQSPSSIRRYQYGLLEGDGYAQSPSRGRRWPLIDTHGLSLLGLYKPYSVLELENYHQLFCTTR